MSDTTTAVQTTETQTPEATERHPVATPRVDIYERPEGVVLVADLPGVSEQTVDIELEGDLLTISARPAFEMPEGFEQTYGEFRASGFYRQFRIGERVDREKIQASVRHGVLRVELPKAEEAQPRKIQIRVD